MLDTRTRIETTTRLGSLLDALNTRLLDARKNDARSTSNRITKKLICSKFLLTSNSPIFPKPFETPNSISDVR